MPQVALNGVFYKKFTEDASQFRSEDHAYPPAALA